MGSNWKFGQRYLIPFFIDILKLFVNMHLKRSTNFMIFGPTDQKLWGNEKFATSLGSNGANQQELTTCAQKCGQEEEREFCKGGVTGTRIGPAIN
jgi:hypothetical protein